jgi:hypothetical protein
VRKVYKINCRHSSLIVLVRDSHNENEGVSGRFRLLLYRNVGINKFISPVYDIVASPSLTMCKRAAGVLPY